MLTFIFLIFLTEAALSATVGSINVQGYGEVWVLADDWSADKIEMHDNGFTMRGSSYLYFVTGPVDEEGPGEFWQTPLMDRVFSYSVDLSNLACDCVISAYFLAMSDQFCDAGSQPTRCPEYDIMEGNSFTVTSTIHECQGDPNNWESCDMGGCMENSYYVDPNMLCPEERCTINTRKPFVMSHFQNTNQTTTFMRQDGRTASYETCSDSSYLANMAVSYGGMVFNAALWAGDDITGDISGWPDDNLACGMKQCWYEIEHSTVSFTDFKLTGM